MKHVVLDASGRLVMKLCHSVFNNMQNASFMHRKQYIFMLIMPIICGINVSTIQTAMWIAIIIGIFFGFQLTNPGVLRAKWTLVILSSKLTMNKTLEELKDDYLEPFVEDHSEWCRKVTQFVLEKKNVHGEVSSKSGWQMPSPCVRSE